MTAMVAMIAANGGGGAVGPLVLIFIFLLLTAGLVLVIRLVLAGLHGSRPSPGREGLRSSGSAPSGGAPEGGQHPQLDGGESSGSPLTGRILKRRYVSGKISQAEYDEQLRRLQIEEFLEDEE